MLHSIILLALLGSPEPAAFEIRADASRRTDWTVMINGNRVEPGRTYVTAERFYGVRKTTLTVRFVDGDEVRSNTVEIELRAGSLAIIELYIPRVYPTEVLTSVPVNGVTKG